MSTPFEKHGGFGNQVVLFLVVLAGASAGTWLIHSPEPGGDRSGTTLVPPAAPITAQVPAATTFQPSPVLRPLALLASTIGPEPLFWLKKAGEPEMSGTYTEAIRAPGLDPCGLGAARPVAQKSASPFDRPLLKDEECALIAEVKSRAAARN